MRQTITVEADPDQVWAVAGDPEAIGVWLTSVPEELAAAAVGECAGALTRMCCDGLGGLRAHVEGEA